MTSFVIESITLSTLLSCILVITAKNPVIAVTFLVSTFVNSAGYLILSGIGFIGISYIIVYVGAITVLFLFVVMMIDIKETDLIETGYQYTKNLPLALGIGILFIFEIFTLLSKISNSPSEFIFLLKKLSRYIFGDSDNDLLTVNTAYNPNIADTSINNFTQIEAIGQSLYTFGSLWLIVTAVILLLSMLAPIFIAKKNSETQIHKVQSIKSVKKYLAW